MNSKPADLLDFYIESAQMKDPQTKAQIFPGVEPGKDEIRLSILLFHILKNL